MDPFRHTKAQQLRAEGKTPYVAKFDRTHTLAQARNSPDGVAVRVAGRIMLMREMGKVTFLTLQDHSGRLQIALKEDILGAETYAHALRLIDLGDFVGMHGERFTTQKGEPTVRAKEWTMLSKALRQPPEKWHGIGTQETAWRQRYLDTTSNRSSFDRFLFRSLFIRKMREFYWSRGFIEMETPVLVNRASGALANPFVTHHNAYDLDVYLRIAPETFLKECLVGGYDRVFEIARVFRNEGLDPSHLQDFTMAEHYAAYWDYEANMRFTEEMFAALIPKLIGAMEVSIPDRDGRLQKVDFAPPWPRVSLRDIIRTDCGIDIEQFAAAGDLRTEIVAKGVRLDVSLESLGRGGLIDQLYKKVSRPKIVRPIFVTDHPIDLSPLARRSDANPNLTDRFQLVVGGWEIVNAYSELVDPIDQARRFAAQAADGAGGDPEAHRKDDEFVAALEYGCPPCSGWGMGIDRIVALLTQQTNLRDVVLFPLMKPLEGIQTNQKIQKSRRSETGDRTARRKTSSDFSASSDSSPKSPMGTTASTLLQHAEYGHLLPAAHGLLREHAKQTKAHLIATGAAMETLAKRFGGDPQTWKVAGMLHDLDWDHLDKDYEKHCGEPLAKMLATIAAPQELLADIRAHYADKYGVDYPLDTQLRKCLYCIDELTGFIIAVTLVRPSKKIADVEVKSVTKKLKDKTFAAQVNREQIKKCEELLGIPLDEFVSITLEAMKGIASDLGLSS